MSYLCRVGLSTPENWLLRRPDKGTSIPKRNFEIIPSSGSSYHDTQEKAQSLVASGQAKWDGPKRIKLQPDVSKKSIWEPKQSGYAGPLVLQLT